MRQLPGVVAAPQQGGTQQAVVEAPGDQLAGGQPGRDQRRAVGMRGEQPVRRVGVDLRQVQAILALGWARVSTITGMRLSAAGRKERSVRPGPPPVGRFAPTVAAGSASPGLPIMLALL